VRVALLSYRSKPHVGGQGVYLRHLSRELVALGHDVEVFSGPPYPELDAGVRLTQVPSLDLYREPDPFRIPRLREFRDLVDVREFLAMCVGTFPEPRTFGIRVARVLRDRLGDIDVVHDNQTLAYGMLAVERLGLPLVTQIHHPITFDRRVDLAHANWRKRLSLRRWYSFLRMQGKVARQVPQILTVSESSKRDIVRDFGVDPAVIEVIPLGVDEVFRPPAPRPVVEGVGGTTRVPGRIIAMASADTPMKGVATLLEAVAKLRTERTVELVLVTRPSPGGRTEQLIERLGLEDCVRFVNGISDAELVELMGSAEVACVPSLYEGFSLPTAELMACETPLVVSRAGAIPEVVGPDGLCADLVTPGDVAELYDAVGALLDDPERRARMGAAGRERVLERFSWHAVAVATAAAYERAIEKKRKTTC
jgi:glycosyltransferase involved in cell wall biosynthesis